MFPFNPPLRTIWRARPFVVHSPLPPGEAVATLQASFTRRRSRGSGRFGDIAVAGYASTYDVVIRPYRIGERPGPIPQLRGQLFAMPDGGSELVGQFRGHPFLRAGVPVSLLVVVFLCGPVLAAAVRQGGWDLAAIGAACLVVSLALLAGEVSRGLRGEPAARDYICSLLKGVDVTPSS